jgi:hypothetical protein
MNKVYPAVGTDQIKKQGEICTALDRHETVLNTLERILQELINKIKPTISDYACDPDFKEEEPHRSYNTELGVRIARCTEQLNIINSVILTTTDRVEL